MYGDDYDFSVDTPRILSGEFAEYVVTHPGRSQYSQEGGGVSACGLAALNCARVVLNIHAAGLGSAQLVQELVKRSFLENILRPCLSWSNSAHLAVDEIYKAPIFHKSLKQIHSDYGRPSLDFFENLISNMTEYSKKSSVSTCVIVTRPPEIIACFCIADVPNSDLFVIFDSHPRPDKHPYGAAFIFKNSVKSAAVYLAELLRYDERILAESAIQWQAQLLAHVSGDTFIAHDLARTSAQWAEDTLDASLQALSLQARVKELEAKNENLEADRKRLNEEVSELENEMLELDDEFEQLKSKYAKMNSSRVSDGRPSSASSPVPRSLPRSASTRAPSSNTHPSSSSPHSTTHSRRHNGTPTMHGTPAPVAVDAFAAQLQKDFDQEDRQLQRQFQHLKDTQPTFFDCGVCFEHLQEDHVARVMPCGHCYCRPCLRDWAVAKIEEHRYPILCPTCGADKNRSSDPGEVEDAALQQLGLTEKQYEIFSEMQLARFSTIIHCRKCLQTIFVDKGEYQEAQEIVCPLPGCGYAWCKMCSQAIPIGGPKHSCDGSSELKHLMSQRGWKHCPGCQTPAEKIEGCNHITCMSPGCNVHFCYLCGELIVQSVLRSEIQSAVTRHYRRCTLF